MNEQGREGGRRKMSEAYKARKIQQPERRREGVSKKERGKCEI